MDASASELPQDLRGKRMRREAASELPQDVIELVLLRLPASSAARFRCVSKPWKSLLTSSKFLKSHHDLQINSSRSRATSIIVSVGSDEDADPPHLHVITADGRSRKVTSPLFREQPITLYGVCHGFILVGLEEYKTVYVFNPVTLEAVQVPGCKEDVSGRDYYCWRYRFGLGYDSVSDDYKIVRFLEFAYELDGGRLYPEVDVYSLKNKSWSRLRDPPIEQLCGYQESFSFVNGRLHCPAVSPEGVGYVLLAFDMAREEFMIFSPPYNEFSSKGGTVTVFGECLAVLNSNGNITDLWVMKEYGGVPEPWQNIVLNVEYVEERFICLFGEDEIVFKLGNHLHVYSLSTDVVREWDVGFEIRLRENVLPFAECLLSPTTY